MCVLVGYTSDSKQLVYHFYLQHKEDNHPGISPVTTFDCLKLVSSSMHSLQLLDVQTAYCSFWCETHDSIARRRNEKAITCARPGHEGLERNEKEDATRQSGTLSKLFTTQVLRQKVELILCTQLASHSRHTQHIEGQQQCSLGVQRYNRWKSRNKRARQCGEAKAMPVASTTGNNNTFDSKCHGPIDPGHSRIIIVMWGGHTYEAINEGS